MHSLKLAFRFLWKDRAFAALAIIVLTIGIGGVATQFSIVNGMLLRLPTFPEAERLVSVSLFDTARNQSIGGAASQDFVDWRSGQHSFEELAMYGARLSINVTYQDVPRRYGGVYVTHTFFRTLGLRPLLGRDFAAADDQPGAPKTLIISHQLWQSDFGGASDIIGQAVQINGRPGTIIGVMPRGFSFPFSEQVWTPMFAEFGPRPRSDPQAFGGAMIGRLQRGVTLPEAIAEFNGFARAIATDFPQTHRTFTAVEILPLAETFVVPQMRRILVVMLGAVGVVLLIAVVNVMNMQFARATRRTRDLAVCSALGATRWQLLRQMLVESLVLGVGGGIGGALFANWATTILLQHSRSLPTPPPAWVTFELDARVLLVTTFIAVGAAVLSGLVPAWLASRRTSLDLLREGGRGATSRRTTLITRALVVLQIALSASLLVVCTFMIRSAVNQHRIDWGYDTRTVLAARMTLFQADHPSNEALGRFFERVLQTLREDPNFAEAALTTRFRLAISNGGAYEVEGKETSDDLTRPRAAIEPISDRYFATLGMKLLAGRDFNAGDTLAAPPVAIVNAAFVRRHFGSQDPLGRRIRLAPGNNRFGPWMTIVGIAPDTHMQGPYDGRSDGAGIFQPIAQAPQRWVTIIVRGRGGVPVTWAEPLRKAMAGVDRNLPVYMINSVDQLIAAALDRTQLLVSLFTVFGLVAMLLAAVGLYGVISFGVSQRTSEYGIRMALGADASQIMHMILREGGLQLVIGLAAGLSLAVVFILLGTAVVADFLYGVSMADPIVWGTTVALLAAVSFVACVAPARRAMRVDPVVALRAE